MRKKRKSTLRRELEKIPEGSLVPRDWVLELMNRDADRRQKAYDKLYEKMAWYRGLSESYGKSLDRSEPAKRVVFMQPDHYSSKDIPRSKGVYIIRGKNTGRIKIGVASNLRTRISSLRVASPVEIEVLQLLVGATFADEQRLHERFAQYRAHGEWFDESPELLAFVEEPTR